MTTNNTLLGRQPTSQPHRRRTKFWLFILLIVLAALAAIGIIVRMSKHEALAQRTKDDAIPTVSVVKASVAAMTDDLKLPGTLQAFVDAPLYARTDGYLKAWYFDIGAKVKKGQLIAEIETPELDQQLEQARAAVNTAKANYDLAVVTNKRYQVLVASAAVSKQEADQSASNQAAQKANVDQAVANVKHYEALQSFEKIYAPFDGVVTARNTDVGQLVTSGVGSSGVTGTGANSRELFHVAAIDKLRTFIPVPQNQALYITTGAKADIKLLERPAFTYPAVVTRTSSAIDNTSRTLLTEVDIDNRKGELLPGSYVDVHLRIPSNSTSGAVRVPPNVMLFRGKGTQIAVVESDNKIKLHDVQVGRDFGNSIEIVSGISKDDQLVLNPPDSMNDGQQVKIAAEPTAGTTASQSAGNKKSDDKDSDTKKDTAKPANKQKEIPPPRGSTEPPTKLSQKPDAAQARQKDSTTDTNNNADGRDDVNGSRIKTDEKSSGGMPATGSTATGTDGTDAK